MTMLGPEVREATKKKLSSETADPVTVLFSTQEPSRLVLPDRLQHKNVSIAKKQGSCSKRWPA